MKKLALVAAAALAATTFGAAAIAQETTAADFAAADTSKDTLVSFDEALVVYPALTQQVFDQADANSDGSLDAAEFAVLVSLSAGLDASAPAIAPSSSAP